jgi:DNA-binding PadR family transcriptional regulator
MTNGEHDVPVADAIGDLARRHPDTTGQTLIDLLTAGYIEAFRRPDGAIAYRTTPEGRKELGRREGRP